MSPASLARYFGTSPDVWLRLQAHYDLEVAELAYGDRMNQIRPWLYIGKYRDTLDYRYLSAHNITAMLLLAELVEHPGITSLYLAVEDGEALPSKLLAQGVEFVKAQKEAGETILVACGAGISRSATFAVAALKEMEGLSLRQAIHIVKQAHPDSMPHFHLWHSLCDYYNEAVPWTEIA